MILKVEVCFACYWAYTSSIVGFYIFLRNHLQSCRLGTGTCAHSSQSHICLWTCWLGCRAAPLRPCCQIRCGDTACWAVTPHGFLQVSYLLPICVDILSWLFSPLLVWHAYICLISLNLAPRLASPVFKQKGISPSTYRSFNRACHYDIIPDFEIFYDIHCKLTWFYISLLGLRISFH